MVSLLKSSLLALTLVSFHSYAKTAPVDCKAPGELETQVEAILDIAGNLPPGGCADSSKLAGICDAVYRKWDGPKGTDYEYMYEKMVHEASCVKPGDSEKIISSKIQSMWSKLENPHLKCEQANFDVSKGNILKYSLKMSNYDFLSLAVDEWKVNLNVVDPNDGRTLLDYVQKELERLKGSPYENRLKGYYKYLRDNGAKHRNELL